MIIVPWPKAKRVKWGGKKKWKNTTQDLAENAESKRAQYMLSIANEVDLLIFHCVCFVCNTNHVFPTTFYNTYQIYMKSVNLLKQFIILDHAKLAYFFSRGGGWNVTLVSGGHMWATQTPPLGPITPIGLTVRELDISLVSNYAYSIGTYVIFFF